MVKQDILRRIMDGELLPGSRLVELHLAKELNTSQGPVREAFRGLEGLEVVVTEPYKGTRVRNITSQDIAEAYSVRAALEELAGQLATSRVKGSVAALKEAATAIAEAADRHDVAAYARHDMSFHQLIVDAAANRILRRTWDSLVFEVRLQMTLMRSNVDLISVQAAHWEIIAALDKGDGAKAGKLLRKHFYDYLANSSL